MTDTQVTQALAEVSETASTINTKVSQLIAEVSELASPDTRASQIIVEVSEIASPVTRVSQIILEVSYTPLNTFTITHSVSALLMITRTKTQSVDGLLKKTFITGKTHSVDALLKKTLTVGGEFTEEFGPEFDHGLSIDALLTKAQTKTTALDAYIIRIGTRTVAVDASLRARGTITTSFDVFVGNRFNKTTTLDSLLSTAPFPSSAKTHAVDILRKKAAINFHRVDAFLFNAVTKKMYALDSLLTTTTTVPEDIDDALQGNIVRSSIRLSRVISRNSALINTPTITVSDASDVVGNVDDSLIDGYNRSSMKFAFADSDATTNDDYRIFPDFDKYATEQYLERQKIPWISDQLSSTGGSLTPVVITIQYTTSADFNMAEIVTDKWGKGSAGIITDMDVEVSTDGSSWTTIANGDSGFNCPEPHRYQLFYYRDETDTLVWTTDKEAFLVNGTGVPLETVSYAYLRFTINSISVDASTSVANRARHLLLYEAGGYLWDVGIQDVNITSFSINEDRDLSAQTLSPIGTSAANTFSATGTVAGKTTPFYSTLIDPYSENHDQYQNALYIAALGIQVSDTSYQYVDYGYFLADELTISAPDGNMNISGRDFSKVLQETKMPPMFYEDIKLHEIIHDIVARAGIEKFDIDVTEYTIMDMAPYIDEEWVSNDAFLRVHSPNMIWSNDQTCWEFLQTIAYADLGVFYFDRDNTFIYRAKEDLIRNNGYPVDYALSEDNDVLALNTTNEIMKNSFKVSYFVPKKTPGTVGLWNGDEAILDTTSLTEDIDATQTTIGVGDITDWQEQGYFQIGNEIIKYSERDDNSFIDCERGWLGTLAAAHVMSNSSSNWDFAGGTWSVTGGVLEATGQGGSWGTALTADIIDSNRYNLNATVTINEDPYAAALLIRAFGVNNHYRFVFRTYKIAGVPGASPSTDPNIYGLYQVEAGVSTLLKEVAFEDANARVLTSLPFEVKAQVDGNNLTFWVGGARVMHYSIRNSDLQITMPAKVGMGAKGAGPTTFENVFVETLPEDRAGREIIFTDTFGRPIYEIRKYEVDYQPNAFGGKETIPPASGIEYVLTNSEDFSIPYFEPGPFRSIIYVKNNTSQKAILVGNGGDENTIPESFELLGNVLFRNDNKHIEKENVPLIARYGRQELDAQLPWVESDTHARILLKYLQDLYSKATLFLDIDIAPQIQIQLGDIITLTSTGNEIWLPASSPPKFFVVGNKISVSPDGIKQSIRIRNVVE